MEPLSLQSDEAHVCNRHEPAILPAGPEVAVYLLACP